MSIKSKCSECEKEFEASPISEHKDGVEVYFFECPHCKERFLIYVLDDEINKGIDRAQELSLEYQDSKSQYERQKIWNRLERRKQKNRKLMKDKMEEYSELIKEVLTQNKP